MRGFLAVEIDGVHFLPEERCTIGPNKAPEVVNAIRKFLATNLHRGLSDPPKCSGTRDTGNVQLWGSVGTNPAGLAKGKLMATSRPKSETLILASSKGVARACLFIYLMSFLVFPAAIAPGFNFFLFVWSVGVTGFGVAAYLRFTDMRLVVGDDEVIVVNLFKRYSLETASARIIAKNEHGFWAEGKVREGEANILTLTDVSEQEVTVSVAPTFGERYQAVVADFNVALARHRLAG